MPTAPLFFDGDDADADALPLAEPDARLELAAEPVGALAEVVLAGVVDAGADAAVSMLLLVSFSASIAASKRGVSCFVRIGSGTADGIRVSFDTDADTEIRRGHLERVVVKVLTFS